MPKKSTPGWHTRSESPRTLLKPLLFTGLAATALVAIVWLAAAVTAPSPKSILPAGAMEFMHAAAPYSDAAPGADADDTDNEWRLASTHARGHASSGLSSVRADARAPGRESAFAAERESERGQEPGQVNLPKKSSRDLLASRFAETPSSRRRAAESPRESAPEPQSEQPPLLALTLARAAIADSAGHTAMPQSESGNESESGRFPIRMQPVRLRPGPNSGNAVASASALASASGSPPLTVDDLFSLKLKGEYGTSKASLADGDFRDRFLVLGGKKKFEFAGMDQMDLKMDGVITTGGDWNTEGMNQSLSGIALNAGPEIKFPELPVKLDLNLGVAWLKRESTLTRDDARLGLRGAQADIDTMAYGGGAALRSDWRWRMFTVTGMAGVQYAAATDKSHAYKAPVGAAGAGTTGPEIAKLTRSAWELPLQLRFGGEYKLLNALSVLPSLWGGYTHNITGQNGAFHNGHLAGAESTWRRHGMTWNDNSWHFGGELRIRAVDRFELWIAHQKEWAGDNTGSYTGGGLQIAF